MARIVIFYDPKGKIAQNAEMERQMEIKSAALTIPEDVRSVDIYNLAKKLAELLLETL